MIQKMIIGSLCILCVVRLAYGATDSFIIGLQVGSDTTPPSTPTALMATPVAQTQIDLSWGASTDDFLLGGYQVFRNAIQIATTTLTTYSDSGLTANTSYSYFVRAFDSSFNISSSSNTVSTSTFAATSTTTPSSGSSGGNIDMRLLSFDISPSIYNVQISWQTSSYAKFTLQWGRTSSYESGFVANELYKKEHSTIIDELEPGTTYEFELVAYDHNNHKTVLKRGQFKTLQTSDLTAPVNVRNLKATADGDNILLTWDNPPDTDFSHVRIVRSNLFYPLDQQDGFIAYVGSSNTYYDQHALQSQTIEYYTVFSYDENGNISSGAVVSVRKKGFNAEEEHTDTPHASPTILQTFTFGDIEFVQDKKKVGVKEVNTELPLTLRIPYEKLPEHLKTILVTFTHPHDKESSFSFLLKVNKDKTYYEASIDALRISGEYLVEVVVYDYQTQKLFTIQGMLEAHKKYLPRIIPTDFSKPHMTLLFALIVGFILSLLFLLFIMVLKKRSSS